MTNGRKRPPKLTAARSSLLQKHEPWSIGRTHFQSKILLNMVYFGPMGAGLEVQWVPQYSKVDINADHPNDDAISKISPLTLDLHKCRLRAIVHGRGCITPQSFSAAGLEFRVKFCVESPHFMTYWFSTY